MPLRQSRLNFSLRSTTTVFTSSHAADNGTLGSSTASPIDTDTIIVTTTTRTDTKMQLPTPSESATDVSSQSSQIETPKTLSKSRSKRVSSSRSRQRVLEEDLDLTPDAELEKSRSVSGETLVATETTVGQSSVLQDGVKILDLSWNESSVSNNESKAGLLVEEESNSMMDEDSEDEKAREERWLARKAKMDENAKMWEERRKAADKNATRRSGRASLLSKASNILEAVKDTVLGKRTRSTEKDAGDTKSKAKVVDSNEDTPRPQSKKQRLNDQEPVITEVKQAPTAPPRGKKWLVSGLYAGQPHTFNSRIAGSVNKKKAKGEVSGTDKYNKTFPLPMYAGERLLTQGRDFKLPWDVFSPLPAGQPKPDEWKRVNKNVFVGDAAAEWRESKFVEHSTCMCDWQVGCDQNCMNRYMYYECDEKNCNMKRDCGNRAFSGLRKRVKDGGKYNVGVEVIKTEDRGYGVRSNRSFEPNQIIVEYTGEIITQEECEQRMRTIYKNNECYYLMLFDQNMIIDATRGSIARFVNHSCEPNCRMEKWTVEGKPRMALFAGDRGIMTGEELTYDYNFDPYSQKNVQECRCGSVNCRKVLGPKPKPEPKRSSPEDEAGKKKASKLSGAKRKVAEVLSDSTSRVNKKKRVMTSPQKKRASAKTKPVPKNPKRKVFVKKAASRKVSLPTNKKKLVRNDSKLKKMLVGAKTKAGSIKTKRAISSSSANEALLAGGKKRTSVAAVARSSSLKDKAQSIARSVRQRGRTITLTM